MTSLLTLILYLIIAILAIMVAIPVILFCVSAYIAYQLRRGIVKPKARRYGGLA